MRRSTSSLDDEGHQYTTRRIFDAPGVGGSLASSSSAVRRLLDRGAPASPAVGWIYRLRRTWGINCRRRILCPSVAITIAKSVSRRCCVYDRAIPISDDLWGLTCVPDIRRLLLKLAASSSFRWNGT
jgi:hypothetical protein